MFDEVFEYFDERDFTLKAARVVGCMCVRGFFLLSIGWRGWIECVAVLLGEVFIEMLFLLCIPSFVMENFMICV